jgi:D-3-phosphoglycerate dehydrogenase
MTSFPRERIKVLLFEDIHNGAVQAFRNAGYTQVTKLTRSASGDELHKLIKDAHVIGIRSKTQIREEQFAAAKKLLAVGCFCIGTNQVDLNAATIEGVPVFNSPYSNTRSVAELVLAESIMLMRRIPERNAAAHQGRWLKDAKGSNEVRGKTLGIIGYGHIGSQVSVLAESLGLNVLYYDVDPKLPLGNAVTAGKLNDLLKQSDIVTLHVPGGSGTELLMGEKEFAQMKRGAVFLNLARGTVVDIPALVKSLKSGRIRGAAVDVFPVEPKSKQDEFYSELRGLHNVILTPHIGGSTREAQASIGLDVSQKLIQFLETGTSTGSHSIPALRLPRQEKTHRILHIHENKAGVLGEINARLSDTGINILGQYLKTNAQIGYVVLDVDSKTSKRALSKLKEVPHTIRTRILY